MAETNTPRGPFPSWMPEALMNSSEKRELVEAIDSARFDRWLEGTPADVAEDRLVELLECYEYRRWPVPDPDGPSREVRLTPIQRKATRRLAAMAVHAAGGEFRHRGELWLSDGERLWKSLPI